MHNLVSLITKKNLLKLGELMSLNRHVLNAYSSQVHSHLTKGFPVVRLSEHMSPSAFKYDLLHKIQLFHLHTL